MLLLDKPPWCGTELLPESTPADAAKRVSAWPGRLSVPLKGLHAASCGADHDWVAGVPAPTSQAPTPSMVTWPGRHSVPFQGLDAASCGADHDREARVPASMPQAATPGIVTALEDTDVQLPMSTINTGPEKQYCTMVGTNPAAGSHTAQLGTSAGNCVGTGTIQTPAQSSVQLETGSSETSEFELQAMSNGFVDGTSFA